MLKVCKTPGPTACLKMLEKGGKNPYIYIYIFVCNTVEPVYNGHLGTRYIWPLYTGGCYRENLYKVVSSILVAMAVINERLLLRGSRQPQCSNIFSTEKHILVNISPYIPRTCPFISTNIGATLLAATHHQSHKLWL